MPSRMVPAIYESASATSVPRIISVPDNKGRNSQPRKNWENATIVKGLINQFTTSVNTTGFGACAARFAWEKSIFTMMGYIMKNRQIAIGIET